MFLKEKWLKKSEKINFSSQEPVIFSRIYKNAFVKENITVKKDATTDNKLNHNCEVVIVESIGRNFVLFLILICNQNIDNG